MSTVETVTRRVDSDVCSGFAIELVEVKRFKRLLLALKKAAAVVDDSREKYVVRMEVLRCGVLFRGEIRDFDDTEQVSVEFFIHRDEFSEYTLQQTDAPRFTFDLEDVYELLKGRDCGGVQRIMIEDGVFAFYSASNRSLIEYELVV